MIYDRNGLEWEAWEEEVLKNLSPRRSYDEIGKMLGRSESAVGLKIASMKHDDRWPHESKSGNLWSAEEDAVLVRTRGSGMPYLKIAQHLPGRSTNAISRRWSFLRARGAIPALNDAPLREGSAEEDCRGYDLAPDAPPREGSAEEAPLGCELISGPDEGNMLVMPVPPDIGGRILAVISHLEAIRRSPDLFEPLLNRLEQSANTIKHAEAVALVLLEESKRREKAARDLLPNYGINEIKFFEEVDTILANRLERVRK